MWHLGMWFLDEHGGGAEFMFKLYNLTGFLICWLYDLQNYCKGVFLDSWVAGLGFFSSFWYTEHSYLWFVSLGEESCSHSSDRRLCCSGVHVLLTKNMQWGKTKVQDMIGTLAELFSHYDSPKPSAIKWQDCVSGKLQVAELLLHCLHDHRREGKKKKKPVQFSLEEWAPGEHPW